MWPIACRVLLGTRTGIDGADDSVDGETQNGKRMRKGGFEATAVPPPYGNETGTSTTPKTIRVRRATLPKDSRKQSSNGSRRGTATRTQREPF